jgi:hypothetical protein
MGMHLIKGYSDHSFRIFLEGEPIQLRSQREQELAPTEELRNTQMPKEKISS